MHNQTGRWPDIARLLVIALRALHRRRAACVGSRNT